MKNTLEQDKFLDEFVNTNNSIILEAVAGAGKTTTLMQAAKLSKGSVAIIAFNRNIAYELKAKLEKNNLKFPKHQAGTCHSFGLSTYKKYVKYPTIDANKVSNIIDTYFTKNKYKNELKPLVRKTISIAKQHGFGISNNISIDNTPEWLNIIEHYSINEDRVFDDYFLIEISQDILNMSNNDINVIDFDDMIYLPLLFNIKFYSFDVVMIDEAQDLNWVRREMAIRMMNRKGKIIACGDPKQSIYSFAGASVDSLDQLKKKVNAKTMNLTYCFRCGSDIVNFSNQWNSVIRSPENSHVGNVSSIDFNEFMKQTFDNEMVMLCRNTKPLVQTAFQLIRNGIPVYVEGRDLSDGLKKLVSKWKVKSLDTLETRLATYKEREMKKYIEKNNEYKVQQIEDKVDTLMVFIERCRLANKHAVSDVITEIDNIFKDTDGSNKFFTLSTIHKSKGKEWKTVFWLDRANTLPSKYAKKQWEIEQEHNLCYVASTRAMHQLIEVDAFYDKE